LGLVTSTRIFAWRRKSVRSKSTRHQRGGRFIFFRFNGAILFL